MQVAVLDSRVWFDARVASEGGGVTTVIDPAVRHHGVSPEWLAERPGGSGGGVRLAETMVRHGVKVPLTRRLTAKAELQVSCPLPLHSQRSHLGH
jgi:hypothetical protein